MQTGNADAWFWLTAAIYTATGAEPRTSGPGSPNTQVSIDNFIEQAGTPLEHQEELAAWFGHNAYCQCPLCSAPPSLYWVELMDIMSKIWSDYNWYLQPYYEQAKAAQKT